MRLHKHYVINLKKNIVFHRLDVTSEESLRAIFEYIQNTYGHLDVLINNAGYAIKGSAFNEEVAKSTIGTNYFGVMKVCEALLPLMREKSRIINVSSGLGVIDKSFSETIKQRLMSETIDPQQLTNIYHEFIESIKSNTVEHAGFPRNTYKVSKALMNCYGRYLYYHIGISRNIFIATVDPGWVKTRMGGENAPLTPEQGADTIVWVSTEPLESLTNGGFWYQRRLTNWTK